MTHEQWDEIIEKADGMGEPIHPFIQEDVHNLIGPSYYTVIDPPTISEVLDEASARVDAWPEWKKRRRKS